MKHKFIGTLQLHFLDINVDLLNLSDKRGLVVQSQVRGDKLL